MVGDTQFFISKSFFLPDLEEFNRKRDILGWKMTICPRVAEAEAEALEAALFLWKQEAEAEAVRTKLMEAEAEAVKRKSIEVEAEADSVKA